MGTKSGALEFHVGCIILHRAWKHKGEIIAVPKKANYLSHVTVRWDNGREEEVWIPSIMLDFDSQTFDWSEADDFDSQDW